MEEGMAPKVHIWSHGRSSRLLLDIDEVFIDARDVIVGDVIRVGAEAWTVTDVQRADGVTDLTIEPADGDDEWPGPLRQGPPPCVD